jgi:hypothetical protein
MGSCEILLEYNGLIPYSLLTQNQFSESFRFTSLPFIICMIFLFPMESSIEDFPFFEYLF